MLLFSTTSGKEEGEEGGRVNPWCVLALDSVFFYIFDLSPAVSLLLTTRQGSAGSPGTFEGMRLAGGVQKYSFPRSLRRGAKLT